MTTTTPTIKNVIGPVPDKCPAPCGRVISPDVVARALRGGKTTITCQACGNRYRVGQTLNEALIPNFGEISRRIAILRVSFHAPTWERKIPKRRKEKARVKVVTKEGEELRTVQLTNVLEEIAKRREIKQIEAAHATFKRELHEYGIPCELIQDGYRVIPFERLKQIFDAEEQCERVVRKALDEIKADWDGLRERAKASMADLWTEASVPTYDGLREAYRWDPVTVRDANVVIGEEPDERVALIDRLRFNAMQKEADKARDVFAKDLRLSLRQAFADLLGALQEAMGGIGAEGRRFAGSNLTNLQEWLGRFQELNVTKDAEIERLATRVRLVLAGKDVDTVKDDQAVQVQVADATKAALSALKTLKVEPKPRRKLGDFGED